MPAKLNWTVKFALLGGVFVASYFFWTNAEFWQWLVLLGVAVSMLMQWCFGWDRAQSHSMKLRQPLLTLVLGSAVGFMLLTTAEQNLPLWLLLLLVACHFVLGSQRCDWRRNESTK